MRQVPPDRELPQHEQHAQQEQPQRCDERPLHQLPREDTACLEATALDRIPQRSGALSVAHRERHLLAEFRAEQLVGEQLRRDRLRFSPNHAERHSVAVGVAPLVGAP